MTSGWGRLALWLLAVVVSAGCASPAPSNPPDLTFEPHGLCTQLNTKQLSPGASCRTHVNASSPENEVGVVINEGDRYRVSVANNHTWKDASIVSHPLCGSKGTGLMNMLASWKRSPNSDWFVLIAEVADHREQIDLRKV